MERNNSNIKVFTSIKLYCSSIEMKFYMPYILREDNRFTNKITSISR